MQLQINIGVVHIKLQSYRLIAAPCGSPGPLITSHLTAKAKGHKSTMRPFHYYCSNLYACIPMDYGPLTSNEPPFELKKIPSESLSNQKPQSSCELEDQFMMILIPSIAHSFASTLALIIPPVAALVLPKNQHSPSHKLQLTLIILLQLH